ncbi:MAG: hypothetical protein JNK23_02380 [Opitutaceae bacterium]|nr:hypothetical protein [Opitutaceae bacterium]
MINTTRAACCSFAAGRFLPTLRGCCAPRTLLLALGLLAPSLQAAPSYPVVAIAVPDERTSKTFLSPLNATEVHKLKMVYGSDAAGVTDKPVQLVRDVSGRDPDLTPVIPYMGGYTTNLAPDAQKAQTTYIKGIAMIKAGKLEWGISNTATTFNVILDIPAREVLIPRKDDPLVTGTYDIQYLKPSQYDSWLRIDNERMQIVSVGNPNTNGAVSVTVVRNYKNTGNVGHGINSNVFSPVYLGDNAVSDPRFDQGYPDNPAGKTIRYALDPGATDAASFRAAIINGYTTTTPPPGGTKREYDGAWWDTFNQGFYNMCDARGNQVRPKDIWNFGTGANYTEPQFISELQDFTVLTRSMLAAPPPGHGPYVIYANTTFQVGAYHLAGDPLGIGTETLVDRPNVATDDGRLNAGCFEDSFLEYVGPSPAGSANFQQIAGTTWTTHLTKMIDAANSLRPYICMVGPAGELSKYINNEDEPSYAAKMRFSYASYLMAVKVVSAAEFPKNSTLIFGQPLLVSTDANNNKFIYRLAPMLFAQIGNPVTANNLTQVYPNGLKLGSTSPNDRVYQRKFQKGLVAVYPWASGSPAVNITVPALPNGTTQWKNADTNANVSVGQSLSLSPGDGLILVAN